MFCSNCGNQLPPDAKFCDTCGAEVASAAKAAEAVAPAVESTKVTRNIVLGTDGKYHWYYEFKLLRNPTILKLLWKIFFWIFFFMWLFLSIVNASDGHFNFKDFMQFSSIFLIIILGFEALVAVGYFIYAMTQGFKYCVMFEMDENGVTHTQMQKQFKKAQAISAITMIMGAASGKPGVVGTGLLAASRQSMVSNWNAVRNVRIDAKHNVIKVNERFNKNQVYAQDEDFQFVADYIINHVPKKCRIK